LCDPIRRLRVIVLDFADVQARLTVTGYAPAIEVENV
jgi:hypothetical protein